MRAVVTAMLTCGCASTVGARTADVDDAAILRVQLVATYAPGAIVHGGERSPAERLGDLWYLRILLVD